MVSKKSLGEEEYEIIDTHAAILIRQNWLQSYLDDTFLATAL